MIPRRPPLISRRRFAAGTVASLIPLPGGQHPAASPTFTNPIAPRGADPWVIRHEDAYLYCFSRDRSVWVSRSHRLDQVARTPAIRVWTPPRGLPYSEHLWAPELHRVDDRWFIYVAADDGRNASHRMYCLERADNDPLGPFHFKAKVADPADKWAIDGTLFRHTDGELYFLWSGWEGDQDVRQDLYIARMANPWTIATDRVLISSPTYEWECVGRPLVNEGPTLLTHRGKTHLVYSASGSWTDHYALGLLTLSGTDPLAPGAWRKRPEPVFSGNGWVISPGHASFTVSPDGREHWIVYHAARRPGAGWDRVVCAQPFHFNEQAEPVFGSPVPWDQPLPLPSGSPL